MGWTIYHNSRCSKSRESLELLYEHNISPTVVDYLRNPPTAETLRALVKKLGVRPREIVRTKETIFASLGLDLNNDAAVIEALVVHPILIERPIIEFGESAVVGRPIEKLAAFLKKSL